MRTTVEIPDDLRARLVLEAARQGERGYSAVVERALRAYFEGGTDDDARVAARRLRGCERGETTPEEEAERLAGVRAGFRTGRPR